MIAFPRFYATVCQQEFSTGATRPCVFTCQDATGQGVGDFVVKFRSEVRGQETGLLFEFLAAQLAIRLGIPMPAPALIELDSLLAEATPDTAVAARIRASVGLNFGTRFLTPGYVTWRKNDSVPLTLRQTAIEIMAFDVVIDNPDRRQEKPNLLWKDDEMFVFDHEVAFAFTRLIGMQPLPFDDAGMVFLHNHPLYQGMRGQDVDLRRFVGELESWSDEEITTVCNQVPREFGTLYLEKIRQWFVQARDRVGLLADALRRILR